MTCALVDFLAIHLDMARDINDPPMPKTAASTKSPDVLLESTPRTLMMIPSRTSIARFVAKNKPIRNTFFSPF